MLILSDKRCLEYWTTGHPERPSRVKATLALLRERHPEWSYAKVLAPVATATALRAHTSGHWERLQQAVDFDADTSFHHGIRDVASLSASATLAAADSALQGVPAFALMRPPGHHAERDRAMGFCYLNNVAIAALEARDRGVSRVAVWDFDAHHGNGTEAILHGVAGTLYVSVHQHPCYPGTGDRDRGNCLNFPVAPMSAADDHMAALRRSWDAVMDFSPELVLVSAGFDAYELDPITQMTLRMRDFQTLGSWLRECPSPVAATLEGGYSDDLPELVDAFLCGWSA